MSGRSLAIMAMVVILGTLFFSQNVFASVDSDEDGLSDNLETYFETDALAQDTDGDGYTDFEEVKNGFSPRVKEPKNLEKIDTDGDKLLDWQEQLFGTKVDQKDTDGDTFTDYDEVLNGFLPTDMATSTPLKRNIVVDRTKQQMHFLVNDVRIISFPVSTGNPKTPTPKGEFAIKKMVPSMRYTGVDYDFKNVKWNMMFFPRYYLHTAYWHNDFGKRTRSHGCVNMSEKDAEFLYKISTVGLKVNIIGETPKNLYVAK